MSRHHPVPSAPISDEYHIDPDAILKVQTSSSPPPRYNDAIQISVEEEEERFVPDDVVKARAIIVIIILVLVSTLCLAVITTHGMVSIRGQLGPIQAAMARDIWKLKNDHHERISKIEDEVFKISETVYSLHTTTSPRPFNPSSNYYDYLY